MKQTIKAVMPRGTDSDGALVTAISLENVGNDRIDSNMTNSDTKGLALEWTNVNYSVETRKAGTLQVLKDLSGRVTPGRVLAILGPSGSGKTSLLNILSGRLNNGVEGDISINGCSIDSAEFRTEVAYVTQEDVHTPLQSVREALHFSAALRLSKEITKDRQNELVNKLLEELMLTKCADTYIGGGRIRGISGGERKRVSIAQELITRPKIIFLDEPTSGLDAYSAYSTITLLKRLAKSKNMTAICTVHQPSSEIFVEFDDCLLLHEGNCVYNGSVEGINSYFAELGKPCPNLYNPADHILFLVQTASEEELDQLYEAWASHSKKVLAQIDETRTGAHGKDVGFKRRRMKGFWIQFSNVFVRDWKNVYRNKMAFVIRFGINFIQQSIIGCVFWRVGVSDNIESHFGAVVLFSVSSMFATAQVVLLSFALERAVFSRDYQNGSYGAAAWVLSKSLVEFPGLLALNAFVILLFVCYMRLQGNYFLLTLLITSLGFCAASMAMVLGTIGKDAKRSLELAPLIYVPQILFAGFFIPITQIPKVLRWVQWICFLKYGINMLIIVELFDEDEAEKQQIFSKLDIVESNWAIYLSVLLMIPVITRTLAAFFAARAADSAYDNI